MDYRQNYYYKYKKYYQKYKQKLSEVAATGGEMRGGMDVGPGSFQMGNLPGHIDLSQLRQTGQPGQQGQSFQHGFQGSTSTQYTQPYSNVLPGLTSVSNTELESGTGSKMKYDTLEKSGTLDPNKPQSIKYPNLPLSRYSWSPGQPPWQVTPTYTSNLGTSRHKDTSETDKYRQFLKTGELTSQIPYEEKEIPDLNIVIPEQVSNLSVKNRLLPENDEENNKFIKWLGEKTNIEQPQISYPTDYLNINDFTDHMIKTDFKDYGDQQEKRDKALDEIRKWQQVVLPQYIDVYIEEMKNKDPNFKAKFLKKQIKD